MNGDISTFLTSGEAIDSLQRRFGTARWRNYSYNNWTYYSYADYPSAGVSSLQFFQSTPSGTLTKQDTNMQSAGQFDGGYFFLVAAVRLDVLPYGRADVTAFGGDDADSFASDLLAGFAQAGVLKWTINQTNYLTLPVPFLSAPPATGQQDYQNRGFVGATPTITAPPWVSLNDRREGIMVIDPQVLLEPSQSFQFSLEFQRGVIPVIATDVIAEDTLRVGVKIDGIVFRPNG
jgi:hypothetical protein